MLHIGIPSQSYLYDKLCRAKRGRIFMQIFIFSLALDSVTPHARCPVGVAVKTLDLRERYNLIWTFMWKTAREHDWLRLKSDEDWVISPYFDLFRVVSFYLLSFPIMSHFMPGSYFG